MEQGKVLALKHRAVDCHQKELSVEKGNLELGIHFSLEPLLACHCWHHCDDLPHLPVWPKVDKHLLIPCGDWVGGPQRSRELEGECCNRWLVPCLALGLPQTLFNHITQEDMHISLESWGLYQESEAEPALLICYDLQPLLPRFFCENLPLL